jgi:hypothetical protein
VVRDQPWALSRSIKPFFLFWMKAGCSLSPSAFDHDVCKKKSLAIYPLRSALISAIHQFITPPSSYCQHVPNHANPTVFLYVFFLSRCLMFVYLSLALQWQQAYRQQSKRNYLPMSVLHALLPVQHVPAVRECASSMAARMPSGMDDEVEAEANWERSKMTSSTPLQLQCACVVELCQLFFFFILLLSQHLLIPSTFGIIMDEHKLRQPPPSVLHCAGPRSRGLAPQQHLHCCLICQPELPSTPAPTVSRLNAGVHITSTPSPATLFAVLHRLLPLPFANLS